MIAWLVALAGASPVETRQALIDARSAGDAGWAAARAALVADPAVTEEDLHAAMEGATRLGAEIVLAWRRDPSAAALVSAQVPATARTGGPVFLADVPVGMAPVVAERVVFGAEPPEVRVALVDWLRRAGPRFTPWLVDALPEEPDARVRAAVMDALRHDDAMDSRPAVLAALRLGLGDPAPEVRAAAARGAGWVGATDLGDALVAAAGDPDDAVAGAAARSLGWTAATAPVGSFEAVSAVLGRKDPRARLEALHALERLDAARAALAPEVKALATDPDARVARAAAALVAPD